MYEKVQDSSNFDDVGDFHEKFNLDNTTHRDIGPRKVPAELLQFRINFLLEEIGELISSAGGDIHVSDIVVGGARTIQVTIPDDYEPDHEGVFDALIDLVYVALGTAHFFGYPWQQGWRLVQRANMAKVRAQKDASDSKRGSSFDVVKPPGWTPPNIARLLSRFGWDSTHTEETK